MKILIISDTHGEVQLYEELADIEADFVLCLGDLSLTDYKYIKHKFGDRCLYILGNHEPKHLVKDIDIINVHDTYFTLDDISFYAFGGSYKYKSSEHYLLYTDEESCDILNNAPKADILLTHDSYKGYAKDQNMAHQGLLGISEYLNKNKPQYHIFGHYHIPEHSVYNDTTEICVYKYSLLEITKINDKIEITIIK